MTLETAIPVVESQIYLDRATGRKLRLRPYFLPGLWMIDVGVNTPDCDHVIEIGPLEPDVAAQLWRGIRGVGISIGEIWEGPFIDFDSDTTWLEDAPDDALGALPEGWPSS